MRLCLTWVDRFVILLTISLFSTISVWPESEGCHPVIMIEPYIICYCLFRILFIISRKWTSVILLIILFVLSLMELIKGYSQILDNIGSKRGQDICIGSFSNSAPFGCFLSVCSCLYIALFSKVSNKVLKYLFAALGSSLFILMTCTLSRASLLSFAVSMAFLSMKKEFIACFVRKNWFYIFIIVLSIVTGLYLMKKPSADGRMLMAKIGIRMMKENGIRGVGLGNYEGAYGKAQAEYFAEYMNDCNINLTYENVPIQERMVADSPTYAFNEFLKMGIEGGPVAMLLFLGLIIAGVFSSYRNNSFWCYPLISISMFSFFSYPFEINLLLMLLVILLASCSFESGNRIKGICFFLLFIFILIPHYHIERTALRNLGLGAQSMELKQLCGNRNRRFMIKDRGSVLDGIYDKYILFALGESLNEKGEYTHSDSILTLGTEISSDPMFWNVMGNNSLLCENYSEAEERYKRAFYMVPNRLYPLYLLSKLYYSEHDTARFIEMTDMAINFRSKVESVNTERLRNELIALREGFLDYEKE